VFTFVSAGHYTLLGYDPYSSGYAMGPNVEVIEGKTSEIHVPAFRPGARVSGYLSADVTPLRSELEYHVSAKHADTGIELDERLSTGENGGCFEFRHLWPGDWTFALSLTNRALWSEHLLIQDATPRRLQVRWSEPESLAK